MAKIEKREHPVREAALAPYTLPSLVPRWMDELLLEGWPALSPMLRMAEHLAVRAPPVDVYEEGADVVLKAELPGMRKEDLEVNVDGDLLTLSGKKEKEERLERKNYHRLERATGSFVRTIRLPAEVVVEKVTATFKDGVLEVRAPKLHVEKPLVRKIAVS